MFSIVLEIVAIYIYIYIHIYVYIYVYIYRERETERQRESFLHKHISLATYISVGGVTVAEYYHGFLGNRTLDHFNVSSSAAVAVVALRGLFVHLVVFEFELHRTSTCAPCP